MKPTKSGIALMCLAATVLTGCETVPPLDESALAGRRMLIPDQTESTGELYLTFDENGQPVLAELVQDAGTDELAVSGQTTVDGNRVFIRVESGEGMFEFDGVVSDDGTEAVGIVVSSNLMLGQNAYMMTNTGARLIVP